MQKILFYNFDQSCNCFGVLLDSFKYFITKCFLNYRLFRRIPIVDALFFFYLLKVIHWVVKKFQTIHFDSVKKNHFYIFSIKIKGMVTQYFGNLEFQFIS